MIGGSSGGDGCLDAQCTMETILHTIPLSLLMIALTTTQKTIASQTSRLGVSDYAINRSVTPISKSHS